MVRGALMALALTGLLVGCAGKSTHRADGAPMDASAGAPTKGSGGSGGSTPLGASGAGGAGGEALPSAGTGGQGPCVYPPVGVTLAEWVEATPPGSLEEIEER